MTPDNDAPTAARPDTLYRVRPESPPGPYRMNLVPLSESLASRYCYEPAGKPDHPQTPHGEWYCHTEDCVVRQVTVRCKLFGEKMPEMRCPACSEPMAFNHWLHTVTLVPAQPG
jgi:hypothetical protein